MDEYRYMVNFILRKDTKNYEDTDLRKMKDLIIIAIEEFKNKGSRKIDGAEMELNEVKDKSFSVKVNIIERLSPTERSFYTRIGAISRTLRSLGMGELQSPHGKLFSLKVESISKTNLNQSKGDITIDYKNKRIMIPKKMTEEYVIKIY